MVDLSLLHCWLSRWYILHCCIDVTTWWSTMLDIAPSADVRCCTVALLTKADVGCCTVSLLPFAATWVIQQARESHICFWLPPPWTSVLFQLFSSKHLEFKEKKVYFMHTWYLSRTPRIYSCKFFLAGVNFYRFYAKNWQFNVYFAVIMQKNCNLLCILS